MNDVVSYAQHPDKPDVPLPFDVCGASADNKDEK